MKYSDDDYPKQVWPNSLLVSGQSNIELHQDNLGAQFCQEFPLMKNYLRKTNLWQMPVRAKEKEIM